MKVNKAEENLPQVQKHVTEQENLQQIHQSSELKAKTLKKGRYKTLFRKIILQTESCLDS